MVAGLPPRIQAIRNCDDTYCDIKYWVSEQQGKVMDECLQLFGGYGYMSEYPIAELYTDARVQRIYGGTNEIMKELASRFM